MKKIIQFEELQDYEKISKLCDENDEPIFIEEEGKIKFVVMSMKVYDKLNSPNI